MNGRIFLLDNGHVYIRDANGREVTFETIEEFDKYYNGTIDLTGEHYIDYEPDKGVYYYRDDPGDFSPLVNRFDGPRPDYEAIIDNVKQMMERQNDPYFGLSTEEAYEYKLQQIKQATYRTITRNMPEWKQIKWREYIRLYEKTRAGETLTSLESLDYEGFPGEDAAHELCYERAIRVMSWIQECVEADRVWEAELAAVSGIRGIKDSSGPAYPDFPL